MIIKQVKMGICRKKYPIYPFARHISEKVLQAMSINNNVLEKAENINFLTVYIIVICLKSHYIRLYLKRTYVAIVRTWSH